MDVLDMPEEEIVTIRATHEILCQMEGKWSEPVKILITRDEFGWNMEFQTHICPDEPKSSGS